MAAVATFIVASVDSIITVVQSAVHRPMRRECRRSDSSRGQDQPDKILVGRRVDLITCRPKGVANDGSVPVCEAILVTVQPRVVSCRARHKLCSKCNHLFSVHSVVLMCQVLPLYLALHELVLGL